MRIAYRIPKATDTHSEYVIRIDFLGNSGYANGPERYVYPYIASVIQH
jgi:hypothetical protein